MNLSRAKTVLICTFLALNIFLLYQLWQNVGYGGFASFGQKEEISRLEIALQNAGLSLEASLPRNTAPVAHLIVEPWRYAPEELIPDFWEALEENRRPVPLITRYFSRIGKEEGELEGFSTYSFGRYELVVNQNGTAHLRFVMREDKEPEKTLEDHTQAARQLMGNISFLADFVHDYTRSVEDGTAVIFRQEYENYPLYAGYAHVVYSVRKPDMLNFYRLEVLGFAEQKREVIPASTALLRFLEKYENNQSEKSIVEFSLGYYTHEYDAERWEIPPVWRIRLNDGEIHYINAFTGNPES